MFWVAVSKDLKPFRPVREFALAFAVTDISQIPLRQGNSVLLLLAGRLRRLPRVHWRYQAWCVSRSLSQALTTVGPYTDPEHMVLAIVDSMICIEMPFFAIAHVSYERAARELTAAIRLQGRRLHRRLGHPRRAPSLHLRCP